MDYAIVENGVVTNVISLNRGNAAEFPAAVCAGGAPVAIGDAFADGLFSRGGEPLLPPLEQATQLIAALDAEIVELTYQNILLELEG